MAIKTILTDLGNVVLHFDFALLVRRLADRSGFLEVVVKDILIDPDSVYMDFSKGKIQPWEFRKLLCERLRMDLKPEEFDEIWCNIFKPNSSVIDLWRFLNDCGYRIVLLSDIDELHYVWVINYFKLDFLDDVVCSFLEGCKKPYQRIYRIAFPRCRCKKSEVVFVDDLKHNITAAQEFGYHAIHYTGDFQKLCKELKKLGVKI